MTPSMAATGRARRSGAARDKPGLIRLTNGLEQHDAGRDRDIQALDRPLHRDTDQLVAGLPGQAPEAPTLGTEHNRHRRAQIGLEQRSLATFVGADQPDAGIPQPAETPRQVRHGNQRHTLGSAGTRLQRSIGQAGRARFRYDDGIGAGRIRGTQTGTEIARVLDLAEQAPPERITPPGHQVLEIAVPVDRIPGDGQMYRFQVVIETGSGARQRLPDAGALGDLGYTGGDDG